MKNNVVGWFEIPVADMERAKKFYSTVFNTEFTENISECCSGKSMEYFMFPMNCEGKGASGALVKLKGFNPTAEGKLIYFSSEDVSIEFELAVKNGGKEMLPRTSIGECGFIAHFLDTEGNRIGLHSNK